MTMKHEVGGALHLARVTALALTGRTDHKEAKQEKWIGNNCVRLLGFIVAPTPSPGAFLTFFYKALHDLQTTEVVSVVPINLIDGGSWGRVRDG